MCHDTEIILSDAQNAHKCNCIATLSAVDCQRLIVCEWRYIEPEYTPSRYSLDYNTPSPYYTPYAQWRTRVSGAWDKHP